MTRPIYMYMYMYIHVCIKRSDQRIKQYTVYTCIHGRVYMYMYMLVGIT